MRRLFDPCGDYRESLCLLAGGVLPPEESARIESHLATCTECRNYHDQFKRVAEPLADWEKNFAGVGPSEGAQARWAKEFDVATKPERHTKAVLLRELLDWGKDMVWPCRRIWAGFATVWVVILAVNLSQGDPGLTVTKNSPRPSPEIVRAFFEAQGFGAEFSRPFEKKLPEPAKPLSSPSRSERRSQVSHA
jgi:anti-sigma factor RsiW